MNGATILNNSVSLNKMSLSLIGNLQEWTPLTALCAPAFTASSPAGICYNVPTAMSSPVSGVFTGVGLRELENSRVVIDLPGGGSGLAMMLLPLL